MDLFKFFISFIAVASIFGNLNAKVSEETEKDQSRRRKRFQADIDINEKRRHDKINLSRQRVVSKLVETVQRGGVFNFTSLVPVNPDKIEEKVEDNKKKGRNQNKKKKQNRRRKGCKKKGNRRKKKCSKRRKGKKGKQKNRDRQRKPRDVYGMFHKNNRETIGKIFHR